MGRPLSLEASGCAFRHACVPLRDALASCRHLLPLLSGAATFPYRSPPSDWRSCTQGAWLYRPDRVVGEGEAQVVVRALFRLGESSVFI